MTSVTSDHSPRDYQLELLRQAKEDSVIIKLNTGSGKTFIAVLLIKELLSQTEKEVRDGGKRIVFLVTTVHLVAQQAAAIRTHTSLNDEDVGEYHGKTSPTIDFWESNRWEQEFNAHKVLIFTAGIFKDILNHAKYSLKNICLLIFDECHHANKNNDYALICGHLNEIKRPCDRPKVLGLTASVVNGNKKESQIASAVTKLEASMKARLITSSSPLANSFGDSTQENVAFFDKEPARWTNFTTRLESVLVTLQEMEQEQRRLLKEARSVNNLSSVLVATADANLVKRARRAVSDCVNVLSEVGAWGALCTARAIVADLEQNSLRATGAAGPPAMAMSLVGVQDFIARLEAAQVTSPTAQWRSNKVDRLLDLLKSYFAADANCRGIVFVEQRAICFALCSLLQHQEAQVTGIRPAFVTGHGDSSTQAKEARMASNQQLETVKAFRLGEKNLLVATKVVEEGMDIQACNLVIKFDCPMEYRSYVQSKGRARAAQSAYIVFIARTLDNGLRDRFRLQDFARVTEQLNNAIQNRTIDQGWYTAQALSDEEAAEDEKINQSHSVFMPFGSDGPRITLNSSMGIINRYIGRLRHDCFFAPRAHVFLLNSEAPRQACVLLPFPCPLRQPILGPRSNNAQRARKWAALEACRQLFEAGELGSDLLPFPKHKKEAEEEEEEEEEEEGVLGKVGSRRRRRLYSPPVAPALGWLQTEQLRLWGLTGATPARALANRPLALYALDVAPGALKACQLDSGSASDLRLGLLFPAPLGPDLVARFPLFFPAGPSAAALRSLGPLRLSAARLDLLQQFHELALSCLLGGCSTFALDLDANSAPLDLFRFCFGASPLPALCGVLLGSQLAFDRMEEAVRFGGCRSLAALPPPLWAGSVLRARHYKGPQQHQRERWVVERVADHLSPFSAFPDPTKAPTYAAYFEQLVSDRTQPLVEVVRLPTVPETALFRHPEAAPRTHRRKTQVIHLIPELCDRYPLPLDLWLLVAPLPPALCRLQQLLLTSELHHSIWPEPRPEPPTLRWGAELSDAAGDLTNLVTALTAIECRDFVNLERLEVMGDTFLKFAVSTVLFAKNEGPRVQEGELTARRKAFISNAKLFRSATKRELHRYFRPRFFDVARDFLPPGYAPVGEMPGAAMRTIPDKALADCVEAIIGFSVVHLSHSAALKTLCWFDIDPGFEASGNEKRFPAAPQPWLAEMNEISRALALERLTADLRRAEAIIGYRFRRQEFLLQAFTHASCIENAITECYQKLEYLGDAVIDFLITRRIFHDGVARGPGELSDLRSALVNNNTFAAVVVREKLHKFLRHSEPRLFKLIPQFEAIQEERNHRFRHIEFVDDCEGNVTLKILGDIFESVAGAIFVDSGFSLEVVDEFISKVMNDVIDDFSKNIPKNPVRMLYETFRDIKFSDVEKDENTGLSRLSVTVMGETFSAVHRNKKTCKRVLAVRILDRISVSQTSMQVT